MLAQFISMVMEHRNLASADLRQIDPTLSRKQVSRLRDADTSVCSEDRLQLIAEALGLKDCGNESIGAAA